MRNISREGGSLLSRAVYSYNLDDGRAEIRDFDLFQPREPLTVSTDLRLKAVSSQAVDIAKAEIRYAKSGATSVDDAHSKSTPVPQDICSIEWDEQAFWLRIKKPFEISPQRPALLTLVYNRPIQKKISRIYEMGSAQPSDYRFVRDHLPIDRVEKIVKLVAHSSSLFEAWFCDASDTTPIALPAGRKHDRYWVEHEFDLSLTDWERARYFLLHLEWPEHR